MVKSFYLMKGNHMKTQVIIPENHEHWLNLREKVITSTKCSALFGLSKYSTEFEVYHQVTGQFESEFNSNERMKWGNRLEESIAQGAAEEMGWVIEPMKEFVLAEDERLGASFDFKILGEKEKGAWVNPAILEIKNVFGLIFKDEWTEDDEGNIEAPAHIECQVQHQLLVSGASLVYIAALVSGNKVVLLKREPSPMIHQAIKEKGEITVKMFGENRISIGTDGKKNVTKIGYDYNNPKAINLEVHKIEEIDSFRPWFYRY